MSVFREDIVALLPHLRGFARSLTSGNAALADDLVQDTMVNALQAQDQFEPGTNLKAWLFTILRNRFHSVMSRKHVTAEVEQDETIENSWWVPAFQESSIELDAFRRAFRLLSPAHREVLVLATIHELPYEKIAEICGCEVGTVKSRVARARGLLKKMMLEGDVPLDPKGQAPLRDKAQAAVAARTGELALETRRRTQREEFAPIRRLPSVGAIPTGMH